jgi:hypothetical protein
VVAVVVIAWLVVMERDAKLLDRGHTLAQRLSQSDNVACARSPSSRRACTDFTKAVNDARRARFLNPDSEPELFQNVLENSGNVPKQSAAIEKVLKREPDNLDAWTTLMFINRGHDNRTVTRGLLQMHRLDPLDIGSP